MSDNSTFQNTQQVSIGNYNIFPEYKIAPGDILDVLYQMHTWEVKDHFQLAIDTVINVKFIHTPELNETQTVRPDGKITLPYVGNVKSVGKTVAELTQDLKKLYAKILRKPDLYITVSDYNERIKELKKDLLTAPRGLSRLTTVRPDGYASFPIIGDLMVVGKSVPQANKELNVLYDRMIPGLHVVLFLEKNAGFLVYVLGEVNHAGPYPIHKPISVIEALTMAGGFKYSSKISDVIILRKDKSRIVAHAIDVRFLLTMETNEYADIFYLRPDDIIFVPKRFISEAADLAKDLSDTLFFYKGWSLGFNWELHRVGNTNQN